MLSTVCAVCMSEDDTFVARRTLYKTPRSSFSTTVYCYVYVLIPSKYLNIQCRNPSFLQPPQMSNCVNQRMEYRVFDRLADRDFSPRVLAVRMVRPPPPPLPTSSHQPYNVIPSIPGKSLLQHLWLNKYVKSPSLAARVWSSISQPWWSSLTLWP